jgi:2-phosphosulfolactate phosphatase
MVRKISAELVAKDARRGSARGDVVIVVDVLRCTSAIVTALANGAIDVRAVKTLSEARSLKSRNPTSILAGERHGFPPKGFDIGNSPREFTPDRVRDRRIIITTTSGTQAINNASRARIVLMGSFLNVTAAAEAAWKISEDENSNLTIAMSGKQGSFSLEDMLCAGAIINHWDSSIVEYSDVARAALLAYRNASTDLLRHVLVGNHAQELVNAGFKDDVLFCTELDKWSIVPVLKEGSIRILEEN